MKEARQRNQPWKKTEREVRSMMKNRKEATERLRQLANSNFKKDEVEISVSYDICLSNTETSLLIVNK